MHTVEDGPCIHVNDAEYPDFHPICSTDLTVFGTTAMEKIYRYESIRETSRAHRSNAARVDG